jgi:hypothetical protein
VIGLWIALVAVGMTGWCAGLAWVAIRMAELAIS